MPLPPKTHEKLHKHLELLEQWQRAINLVSPNSLGDLWGNHTADALRLLPHLPPTATSLMDVGSGAGFPGMVIAINCPQLSVHLVESDRKKAEFLRHVSRETSTPVTVHCQRIESLPSIQTDIITARAFATVEKILSLCKNQITPTTTLLLPKGSQAEKEIEEAKNQWLFDWQGLTTRDVPRETHGATKTGPILTLRNIYPRP